MMRCEFCGQSKGRLFHRCRREHVVAHTLSKQHPLGQGIFDTIEDRFGVGPEWAPTVYGNYYATSVPVYSAVKLRADSTNRPPLKVMRGTREEAEEVDATDPFSKLLRQVNPHWTWGNLIRGTSTYLDLWGSAFWTLKKAGEGSPPTEIYLTRPDKMRIKGDPTEYISGYEFESGKSRIPLRPDEVVWFRQFNPLEELAGLAPIAPVRQSADMNLEAVTYNREVFRKGLNVSNLAIKPMATMTDDEVDDFWQRLKKRFSGSKNAGMPLILSQGMDATSLGLSPRELEWLGSLRWSIEDVSRVYGVPPIMLMDLSRSTYANVDAAERIFWRNMATYLQFLAGEINELLAPQFGEDMFVQFDLSDIEALQPNINEVADRDRQDIAAGIITINEVREGRGKDPVPWGDAWWAPFSLQAVEDVEDDEEEPVEFPFGGGEEEPEEGEEEEAASWRKYKKPKRGLSDRQAVHWYDMHVKRLDKHEQSFERTSKSLFAKQREDVLKKLRDVPRQVTKQPPPEIFIPAEWTDEFIAASRPLVTATLVEEANAQIQAFNLGVTFTNDPSVQAWIDQRAAFWAKQTNVETARLLTQELSAGIQAGETVPQLRGRVEKVFRFNDAVRAERIARTEANMASNRGAMEAYRQSDNVASKQWITALDGRERPAHAAAHRQTRALDEAFLVGGELLSHPGDPTASGANIINCRCAMAPLIVRRSVGGSSPSFPQTGHTNGATTVEKNVITDASGLPIRVLYTSTDGSVLKEQVIERNDKGFPVRVIEKEGGEITKDTIVERTQEAEE